MNNNKSIFSVKLMLEGFRQCKLIGIFALIIMMLGAVFIPLTAVVDSVNPDDIVAIAVEASEANMLLVLAIPAVALMTLVLFHFLNVRSASDMYHALPHKRISVYLSYTGSVLLWTIIIILASTLTSIITSLICSKYMALVFPTVLPYAFSVFLICLLVVGGMLAAINLTGTVFTNVILSGLILFLPRVSFMILRLAVFDSIPFFNDSTFYGGIFGTETNLLFGLASAIMDIGGSFNNVFRPEWHSIIYTLVLALIYLSVGAWLFCRRRSEAAGQSAPTRMHQHVYRIIVTMAYCIIVTAALTNDINDNYLSGDDIVMFIILYLIAVLIYFAYELITTKKIRNLISSLPGLALVAGLNLGLAVGIGSVRNYIVDNHPGANEITSISMGIDSYYLEKNSYWQFKSYVDMKCQDIEIADKEVISLVVEALEDNIKTYKSGIESYYNKYYGPVDSYVQYPFTIHMDNDDIERIVMVTAEDSEKILAAFENVPEFAAAWKNPPKPISMKTMTISSDVNCELDNETEERIYNIYRQELQELSFSDIYESYNVEPSIISFNYTFSENGYTKGITCPVYKGLMNKTTEAYYEAVYDSQAENRSKFKELCESGEYNIDMNLHGENAEGDVIYYYGSTPSNAIDGKEFYSHISKYIKDEPIKESGIHAVIFIYSSNYDDTICLSLSVDKSILMDDYIRENYTTDY